MSLFDWFSRKTTPANTAAESVETSGLGHVDPTLPQSGTRASQKVGMSTSGGAPANRKTERLERREHLYRVVRDAMTRAGVLTASYKFKVLSLDQHGRQYLIMVDLANEVAGATGRLAEIEALIAQSAKTRHEILVTAVYWRVNETVTTGLSRPPVQGSTVPGIAGSAAPGAAALVPELATASATVGTGSGRFDPLQEDEVAAFKHALASVAPTHTPLANSGEIVKSGRRNPAPMDFMDTEIVADDKHSPLSITQYGELR